MKENIKIKKDQEKEDKQATDLLNLEENKNTDQQHTNQNLDGNINEKDFTIKLDSIFEDDDINARMKYLNGFEKFCPK